MYLAVGRYEYLETSCSLRKVCLTNYCFDSKWTFLLLCATATASILADAQFRGGDRAPCESAQNNDPFPVTSAHRILVDR